MAAYIANSRSYRGKNHVLLMTVTSADTTCSHSRTLMHSKYAICGATTSVEIALHAPCRYEPSTTAHNPCVMYNALL